MQSNKVTRARRWCALPEYASEAHDKRKAKVYMYVQRRGLCCFVMRSRGGERQTPQIVFDMAVRVFARELTQPNSTTKNFVDEYPSVYLPRSEKFPT